MKAKYNLLILLIFTLLLLLAAVKIDWGEVFSVASRAEGGLIALAIGVTVFRFLVWGLKWHLLIWGIEASIPFSRTMHILMAGLFVGTATPGATIGGEPFRAYYLAKEGRVKKSEAMATVTADKVGNYIAFSTYIFLGIIMLTSYFQGFKFFLFLILSLLAVLGAYYYYRKRKPPWMEVLKFFYSPLSRLLDRKFGGFENFAQYLQSRAKLFLDTVKVLGRQKRKMAILLLLSYLMWFTSFVKTYLVFVALGVEVDFLLVLAVKALSVFVGLMSFLPGGVGVTEGAMAAMFTTYGMEAQGALAGVLLSRAIYYAFALGIGYLSILWLRVAYRG